MQSHIEAWKSSGLTQVQYCQKNNIKSHIFTYYKSKLGYGPAKMTSNTLKVVYLATMAASKKWTMPIRNWKPALNRFIIENEEQIAPHI